MATNERTYSIICSKVSLKWPCPASLNIFFTDMSSEKKKVASSHPKISRTQLRLTLKWSKSPQMTSSSMRSHTSMKCLAMTP